jgi:hypothetical protein
MMNDARRLPFIIHHSSLIIPRSSLNLDIGRLTPAAHLNPVS